MIDHGFVAVTDNAADAARSLTRTLAEAGVCGPIMSRHGPVVLACWGLPPGERLVLLTKSVRTRWGDESGEGVASRLGHQERVAELIPPFGALLVDDRSVEIVADAMGLRQLYHGVRGAVAGVSSSALLLGRVLGSALDPEAVAVQSLLGWQLGQRTLVDGVTKLEPGMTARLGANGLDLVLGPTPSIEPIGRKEAVTRAAALLRTALETYLDDRPGAVLQLTGGQDSRLLLSAVPSARRRRLGTMTLGSSGDGDVDTASLIAERYAMPHEVHDMTGLESLDPAAAWERCVRAANRLDGMSDPLAFAGLEWAESKFVAAPRLSGLGGEVARGFYYLGPGRDVSVTPERSRRLADWRMFANESAESAALDPAFRTWARSFATGDVARHLLAGGSGWLEATDALYLRHRMQRWAGVTETAWCLTREIFNPMLDHEFLELAGRMRPTDKRNSRFLAELQMELDPDLGYVPLEGRPAPVAYTRRSVQGSVERLTSTGRRLSRKVRQRVARTHRPPAGGAVLAAKVAQHWQEQPHLVTRLSALGLFNDRWIADVSTGRVLPEPSTVAFVTSLVAAQAQVHP